MDTAAELADLTSTIQVLDWDQQTYMPKGGGKARAEQLATLQRLVHERLTHPEVGDLLQELSEDPKVEADPFYKAFVREFSRRYEQSVRLPTGACNRVRPHHVARYECVGSGKAGG